MKNDVRNFRPLSRTASRDKTLREILKKACIHFKTSRDNTYGRLPDLDERRRRAAAVRLGALNDLASLLEQLEENVVLSGGRVHWAQDASQARNIIGGIAEKHAVRRIVKGKSIMTEEIGLNEFLEERGIHVRETDLGEYIVQLRGEGPSHIIAPCVHVSKQQVADLFAKELGETAEEAEELTLIARKKLREEFLSADMGITGVNLAVAESGTAVLLENEGNIRMSTTCPRVHVAVMSLEKVVRNFEDAAALLNILPRSATGQKLSGYVSFFTGPKKPGENDGPEEFHLVILDNGRSEIMQDEELRKILCCIRCGACLNVCPVYQSIGGHAYGWVYSGPMGNALVPQLCGDEGMELPFACTTCGACKEACPVNIDHPKLILKLRQEAARKGHKAAPPALFAWGYALAGKSPLLWNAAMGTLRTLDPNFKVVGKLPPLRRWGEKRVLPGLQKPLSRRLKNAGKEKKNA